MTDERFASLVSRLERDAERQPGWYRLRVGLLVWLGLLTPIVLVPAVFGILTFVLIRFHAGLLIVKLGWILAIALFASLRSLFFPWRDTDGEEIYPHDAPALFELIEKLRAFSNVPRLNRVAVDAEINASVTQAPRFGLFGGTQRTLTIGLPLLSALTPQEFEAVLAHEFGHLERRRNRFSTWVYKIRAVMFKQLAFIVESHGWIVLLLRPFYNVYIPYFMAYSFVLARQVERIADGMSVELVGAETTAKALVLMHATATRAEVEYNPVFQREIASGESQGRYVSGMRAFMHSPYLNLKSLYYAELLRQTDATDTHPALVDRLRAIGVPFERVDDLLLKEARSAGEDAATYYLGPSLSHLTDVLDREAAGTMSEWLQILRKQFLEDQATLQELDAAVGRGETLTPDQRAARARLAAHFERADAEPLMRELHERSPNDPMANVLFGHVLLDVGREDEALERFRAAASVDPELGAVTGGMLRHHWIKNSRFDERTAALAKVESS